MKRIPKITRIELYEFEREIRDMGDVVETSLAGWYQPGTVYRRKRHALRIHTDVGVTGEYVSRFSVVEAVPVQHFARALLGRSAFEREKIYNEVKRLLRHVSRMGWGPIDIALWDLAGKYYDAPIYQLLGAYRKKLPVYASTVTGDESGGLDSPEVYADFAEQCLEMGYRAFKIHPWWTGPISREIELVHAVGQRVGGKMDLMLDPACAYETFGDAVKVGRALDEEGFYWFEDPFQDGGVSHFAHRNLRQLIKTPLLLGEHVRGLEARIDFALAEATDFIRADVNMDGITGTMKLAHAAESIGLDVEYHGGAPAALHCMAATRNANYYEWGLLNPKIARAERAPDPFYRQDPGYGKLDGIDENGCIPVPEGPGLGVEYNWDFILAHQTGYVEFK